MQLEEFLFLKQDVQAQIVSMLNAGQQQQLRTVLNSITIEDIKLIQEQVMQMNQNGNFENDMQQLDNKQRYQDLNNGG